MAGKLERGDALLVVDVQNDFCPGGALAVPDGDRVVPILNRWIAAAVQARVPVHASRCWHPASHVSFRSRGGPWPPHCVQNTTGAEFYPDLALPPDTAILAKGTDPDRDEYSAFHSGELAERLRRDGVRRIFVGGLALDYCVRATVLDGLAAGFDVVLLRRATRAVEVGPGDGEQALAEIGAAGAVILSD
ncbi:MAG: nicotinamidase [Candidatus Binatia bacterium]